MAECGPDKGAVVNPDTGTTIASSDGGLLTRLDFAALKHSEIVSRSHDGTAAFSALWQADRDTIQHMAPLGYIGRYMKGWWDYAIADELHQLAQGIGPGQQPGRASSVRDEADRADRITSIPDFNEHDQYKLLLNCSPEMLAKAVIVPFVQVRLDSLRTRLEQFPERAEAYLEVATLARRVGDRALSEACLRQTIDNLLGYTHHGMVGMAVATRMMVLRPRQRKRSISLGIG